MKIKHRGFKVSQMVGDLGAEINDDGDYTEIVVIGFGNRRSFDQDGLTSLIDDLENVQQLATQVDRTNGMNRQASE